MVDILEIYFTEHVKKAKDKSTVVDDFLVEMCTFGMNNGDIDRVQGVLDRIIGFSNNMRPEIAELLAQSFRKQGLYSRAYKYFFKSMNEKAICECLSNVMKSGYQSE